MAEASPIARLGAFSPGRQRAYLVLGCALLYCVWFGSVPLTEIDEARYAEAVREMIESGDYLIPHFNYVPRYQKPILYYWLQLPSVALLGVNEFAARLPSGIMAILVVLAVHAFLLRWLVRGSEEERRRGSGAAFVASVGLATMPLLAIWARAATTDVATTLFTSLTLLALLNADLLNRIDGDARCARRWYLAAALAAGLAFLTKGPIGIAIPGLVWLIYHAMNGRLREEARRVPWLPALGLFLLVAAPWYIATYFVDGPGFLTRFFLTENLQRFASSAMEGHGVGGPNAILSRLAGLLPYWPIAVLLLFPVSAYLVREVVHPLSGRLEAGVPLAAIRRFGLVWVVADIALFSLSRTQLPSYIQAIVAGAALVFAVHLLAREGADTPPPRRALLAERLVLAAGTLVYLAVPILALLRWALAAAPLGPACGATWHVFGYASAVTMAVPQLPLAIGALLLASPLVWVVVCRPRYFASPSGVLAGWLPVLVLFTITVSAWIAVYFGPVRTAGLIAAAQPASTRVMVSVRVATPTWRATRPRPGEPGYRRIVMPSTMPESIVYYARREVEFYSSLTGERLHPYAASWDGPDSSLREELARARDEGRTVLLVADGDTMPLTPHMNRTWLAHPGMNATVLLIAP